MGKKENEVKQTETAKLKNEHENDLQKLNDAKKDKEKQQADIEALRQQMKEAKEHEKESKEKTKKMAEQLSERDAEVSELQNSLRDAHAFNEKAMDEAKKDKEKQKSAMDMLFKSTMKQKDKEVEKLKH